MIRIGWSQTCLMVLSAGTAVFLPRMAAGQVTFTGIQPLPGGLQTFAYAVSGDGEVVTGVSDISGGTSRAIRWTRVGGTAQLSMFPGVSGGRAHAASGDGSVIVGEAFITSGGRPFWWSINSGMVPIGSATGPFVWDVSGDGNIVVGQSGVAAGRSAVRWMHTGGVFAPQNLGYLPGGTYSEAIGVSADGSVVVGNADTPQGSGVTFRWTESGGMVPLGLAPGAVGADANAVSADGRVIVGKSLLPGGGFEAFRWTETGGMGGLPPLAHTSLIEPLAVNGDGSVVVGRANLYTAYLWSEELGAVDLMHYLHSQGVNLLDWKLLEATGVSDDGRIIVGVGTYRGNHRAWVAVIPSPGAGAVLMLGFSLGWRRRPLPCPKNPAHS